MSSVGSACRTWLGAEGLGFGAGCPGAGPARLDAPPADPGRRDAHVHVAGAARPRLEARSVLKAPDFTLVGYRVRVTVQQDAPAFTERLVEVVDFEADPPAGVHRQQRVRRGAEDDGLSRYREVDRQHHDPVRGCGPDAADAARLQQALAPGRAERPQGPLAGSVPGGPGLPAGPGSQRATAIRRALPSCHLWSLPPSVLFGSSALPDRAGGRCGPTSRLAGPFGPWRHRPVLAVRTAADAPVPGTGRA